MTSSIFPKVGPTDRLVVNQPPAIALYRELSSAAVDAELARLARCWNVEQIEQIVGAFKVTGLADARRRKSFYSLRSGSRLQSGHAMRIQSAFPRSHVHFWWVHPLAQVLCDPNLGTDALVSLIRDLPAGKVRELVWQPRRMVASGFQIERLVPWSSGLVASLRSINSPLALFALITRLRIEQIAGNLEGGLAATQAVWTMLPSSLRRSRNLLLSKGALVMALDFFFSWQPFADSRIDEIVKFGDSIGRSKAVNASERVWRDDRGIPMHIKMARTRHLGPELMPVDANPWSWWGLLYSD